MEDKKMLDAKQMYNSICKYFDEIDWKYKKIEDKLMMQFSVTGKSMPTSFLFMVDAERQLVRVFSSLSFKIPEDKRVEAALATSYANYRLVNGAFSYDMKDGSIMFKMVQAYHESILGSSVFRYLIGCTASTVEDYVDLFLMISNGMLDINGFVEKVDKK